MRQAGASLGLSSSTVCVDELCVLTSFGDIWPGSLPHSLERMDMLEGHGENHNVQTFLRLTAELFCFYPSSKDWSRD